MANMTTPINFMHQLMQKLQYTYDNEQDKLNLALADLTAINGLTKINHKINVTGIGCPSAFGSGMTQVSKNAHSKNVSITSRCRLYYFFWWYRRKWIRRKS